MTREMRFVLQAFAVLALIAGFLLFPLATRTEDWFSWTIEPPLTAAFLGGAYWAAFVLLAWSSRQDWIRARAAIPPVFTIAVGLLVATLIHLDRFHEDLFGRFWIAAYVVVPPLLAAALAVQLRAQSPPPEERVPLGMLLRGGLALDAAVLVAAGAALLLEERAFWPWQLTPLTSMAVGAFLVGFGVAAAHAVVEDDARRFQGAALAYATLGGLELLALAVFADDVEGSTVEAALFLLAAFAALVIGLAGYSLSRRRASSGS